MTQPTLTLLIGLPACGKTTWREKMSDPADVVHSTDDILEQYAADNNIPYSLAFSRYMKNAERQFKENVGESFMRCESMIIDRTNLTKESRQRFITNARYFGYYVIGVVFEKPSIDNHPEWMKRLDGRGGKTIPTDVIMGMINRYQEPSVEEGFDMIIFEDSFSG